MKVAVLGFLRAHVDLAKADAEEIKGEVTRAAALAAAAVACLILLAFLVPIGGLLFYGDWVFGSLGWGLLHGTELLLGSVVAAALIAIRVPGLGKDAVIAVVLGAVVAVVLGLSLPNQLFRAIGEASNVGVDPAVLPLAVGVLLLAVIGGVVGLVIGARAGDSASAALGGLAAGVLLGALLGAFLSITFGRRVGIALGVTAFLAAWPILMGMRVQRQGIDLEELKGRFWPQMTIDTTKESIEWAKARASREPKS